MQISVGLKSSTAGGTSICLSTNTIDFLLIRRQRMSAQSFLIKAIENNGKPELINIDKSGVNKRKHCFRRPSGSEGSAISVYNKRALATKSRIKIRQYKYLNKPMQKHQDRNQQVTLQDHRFIKWRIQQELGFKEFESARRSLEGIEIVRMIKKNQMVGQAC